MLGPTRRPVLLLAPQGAPLLYARGGPSPRSQPVLLCLPHHGHSQRGPAWTLMGDHGGTFQSILLLLTVPPAQRSPCRRAKACMVPSACPLPFPVHPTAVPRGRTGHRSHPGAFLVGLEGSRLPGQTDCAGSRGFTDLNDMEAGGWVRCGSALEHAGALLHTRVVVWARPE